MMIGQLGWEKIDLIRTLKHLAALPHTSTPTTYKDIQYYSKYLTTVPWSIILLKKYKLLSTPEVGNLLRGWAKSVQSSR